MIEQGVFVKHCKVEVYLMELKLCENSDTTNVITHLFSRADTIGKLSVCLHIGKVKGTKEKTNFYTVAL